MSEEEKSKRNILGPIIGACLLGAIGVVALVQYQVYRLEQMEADRIEREQRWQEATSEADDTIADMKWLTEFMYPPGKTETAEEIADRYLAEVAEFERQVKDGELTDPVQINGQRERWKRRGKLLADELEKRMR